MNPFRLTRVLRPVLVRILGCLSETMAQVSLEPRSEAKCRNHGKIRTPLMSIYAVLSKSTCARPKIAPTSMLVECLFGKENVIVPPTMLQNAPFRGWDKREVVNPVDHLDCLLGNFYPSHQGSDHLPFSRPVHSPQTTLEHCGKSFDLRHHLCLSSDNGTTSRG